MNKIYNKLFIIIIFIVCSFISLPKNYIINDLESYIKEQRDFCQNDYKYFNKKIEEEIMLCDVKINGLSYQIYAPKIKVGITLKLMEEKAFEKNESLNILNALDYYKHKKNIINEKDIFMLDIGGNLGWYPSFLGRYGYSILTFEPFPDNYYISRKNYCHLNKNSNIIIINKGLNIKEKTCKYYKDNQSVLNGMTLCAKFKDHILTSRFIYSGRVSLTKLSNFIPYLSNKNLALIKIDAEGAEGNIINSGIELITKYHIPFIFVEITPTFLKEHDTDPMEFIELFINNNYKISINGFLSKDFISANELLNIIEFQINCYFIYKDFIS